MLPNFLDLPPRSRKPRLKGITHVLDKGLSLVALQSLLDVAGSWIDILKLGWGTAYLSGQVREKVAACRAANVLVCPGGTLLEIAAAQRKMGSFVRWAASLGMDAIEVSNGALGLDAELKQRVISELARDFVVLSEVGSKDEATPVIPRDWGVEAAGDLLAGASYVLTEGRESGTVGLYDREGKVREAVIDGLLEYVPLDKIVFEAPRKSQQLWLIRHLGLEVNIGNVLPDDVLGLETLRRGLRADTADLVAAPVWSPELVARALLERSG